MNRIVPIVWRMAVLVTISAGIAAVANALSPTGISWRTLPPQVTGDAVALLAQAAIEHGIDPVGLADTQQLLQAGQVVVLDARDPQAYEAGHLPGAVSMPLQHAQQRFEELEILHDRDQPVLVYCSGPQCHAALQLSLFLRHQGMNQVYLFTGGKEAWRAARLDVAVPVKADASQVKP